jgi:hypothetical protein
MYKFSLISTTSRESSCSPGVGEDKVVKDHVLQVLEKINSVRCTA